MMPLLVILTGLPLLTQAFLAQPAGIFAGQSPLNLGQTATDTLKTGQAIVYRLAVPEDRFVQIRIADQGVDLGLTLFSPSRSKIADSGCRRRGARYISFVSDTSGDYGLEMLAMGSGDFEIETTVLKIRPAQDDDTDRIAAHVACALAQRQSYGGAESRSAARESYLQAAEHWESCGEKLAQADMLVDLGKLLDLSGDDEQAQHRFRQALQIFQAESDPWGQAASQAGLSSILIKKGDYRLALESCQQALHRSQEADDQRAAAMSHNCVGDALSYLWELEQALVHYQQAAALWQVERDRSGQAQALLNLGYTYGNMHDSELAAESLQQAARLWRSVGDSGGMSRSLTTLGTIRSKQGRKQEAIDLFSEALPLLQASGDRHGEAVLYGGMGYTYSDLGRFEQALEYHGKARQLQAESGNRYSEAYQVMKMGECLHNLGRVREAVTQLEESLQVFQELGNLRMQAAALKGLGKAYESMQRRAEALQFLKRAWSLQQKDGDTFSEAYTLNEIGLIQAQLGQRDDAMESFRRALSLNRASGDPFGETATLYNTASLEKDSGNLNQARSMLESALQITESVRVEVAAPTLRTSYFASVHGRHELYIDVLMRLEQRRPDEGWAQAALQAAENARARALIDSLSEAGVSFRQGIDPDLRSREESLKRSINAKAALRDRLRGSDEERLKDFEQEIGQLLREYEDLQALIRRENPLLASLSRPEALSAAEIQQSILEEGTLLIEFALGEERSYVWAVGPDSFQALSLPARSQIEEAARELHSLLTARLSPGEGSLRQMRTRFRQADSRYWQLAQEMSRMLLGKIQGLQQASRLVIVADGALQYLPFAALPLPTPNPAQEADPAPLIASHEVTTLPSASALSMLRRQFAHRQPAGKLLAVLADPVFEPDDPRLASGERPISARTPATSRQELSRAIGRLRGTADGIPRLPATQSEARAILSVAAGESLNALGFSANLDTVTGPGFGDHRILHFATHGLVNNQHPELSGIILSLFDEQGQPRQGFLRLHDIYNLRLRSDLVVLSACSTGLGKDIEGEGLVGLVGGFMYAGSPRVVASLWQVDDEATSLLMKRFYEGMFREGMTAGAALRQAQISLWKQRRWRPPYYWASFALHGEFK